MGGCGICNNIIVILTTVSVEQYFLSFIIRYTILYILQIVQGGKVLQFLQINR